MVTVEFWEAGRLLDTQYLTMDKAKWFQRNLTTIRALIIYPRGLTVTI